MNEIEQRQFEGWLSKQATRFDGTGVLARDVNAHGRGRLRDLNLFDEVMTARVEWRASRQKPTPSPRAGRPVKTPGGSKWKTMPIKAPAISTRCPKCRKPGGDLRVRAPGKRVEVFHSACYARMRGRPAGLGAAGRRDLRRAIG